MAMKMNFNLKTYMNDLQIQVNTKDDILVYQQMLAQALAPFQYAIVNDDAASNAIERINEITNSMFTMGRLYTPSGIDFSRLNKDPRTYIHWVGTTTENAHKQPSMDPQKLFEAVCKGVLHYYHSQFDAGGWTVENDSSTSRIYITLPDGSWTLSLLFERGAPVSLLRTMPDPVPAPEPESDDDQPDVTEADLIEPGANSTEATKPEATEQ